VTKAVLDRIAHWEPSLKASYALDPEGALAQARQAEARWSRGLRPAPWTACRS
jgi:Asp-tRNAAsn/Glu-tRNAGln amidotransferase A subunit and related amidases